MKKIILNTLAISAVLSGSFTYAGEMGPVTPQPPKWTGIYVGGNLGSAWASSTWTYQNINPYDAYGPGQPDMTPVNPFTLSDLSGGVQLGLNYQWNRLVLGPEVAYFWSDLDQSYANRIRIFQNSVQILSTKIKPIFTATGRIGTLINPALLVYGKGGYANATINTTGITNPPVGSLKLNWNTENQHNGWVAGGGMEWMVMKNLTLGIEYNYLNFNTVTHTGAVSGGAITPNDQIVHQVDASVQNVMARVNYLFGL